MIYRISKRVVDFSISLCSLIALAPLLALIALTVYLEDFRSPFFAGARVGRRGGTFRMIKFRTMRPGDWMPGFNSTALEDPRITRIGKLLRRAKLDELPQLWNVVIGQMSLVGPRPQVATDAALYTREERRMLSVRPGITDLASIVFADEGEILQHAANPDLLYQQIIRPWKSRLALLYVDHASFYQDVRILMLTAMALISRRRALDGVARIVNDHVDQNHAEPFLLSMASRREPLRAYPPPGSDTIVEHYAVEQHPVERAPSPSATRAAHI